MKKDGENDMKKEDIILQYLKESKDYLSGEELSRRLGISRSAIWKNINSLRESGYVIDRKSVV